VTQNGKDAAVFEFKKAVRTGIPLFIGLAGGTGSGKTFSALTLARGIVGPKGRIGAGDTEGKRMSHYSETFDFDAVDLLPPFRPRKFEDLAEMAEQKSYDCLVIDSMSHEWNGDGGVLEWHDEELDRFAGDDDDKRGKNNIRAWIAPKTAHKRMVHSFLQRRLPIIFCFRAEEKLKIIRDGRPQPAGWIPIADQRLLFELTVLLTLTNDAPGVIQHNLPCKIIEPHRGYLLDRALIVEKMGQQLVAWAKGAPDKAVEAVTALVNRIRAQSTEKAVDAILAESKVQDQVRWLQKKRPEEHKRLFHTANDWRRELRDGKAR
jgi:hypothetical protein